MKLKVAVSVLLAIAGSAIVGAFGYAQTGLHQSKFEESSSADSIHKFVGKTWDELISDEECAPLENLLRQAIDSEDQLSKVEKWTEELGAIESDIETINWLFGVAELRNSTLANEPTYYPSPEAKSAFFTDLDALEDRILVSLGRSVYDKLEQAELRGFEGYVNKTGWLDNFLGAFSDRCKYANGPLKFAAEKSFSEALEKLTDQLIEIKAIKWAPDAEYEYDGIFIAHKDSQRTTCSGSTECALKVFVSTVTCKLDIEALFSSASSKDRGRLSKEVILEPLKPVEVEILNSGDGADSWELQSARCE